MNLVIRGFFMGIGLAVALGVVLVAAMVVYQRYVVPEMYGPVRYSADVLENSTSKKTSISLSNIEEINHDGITSIIGKATNTGRKPARGVNVQADLFLKGKFVDQYSTYINGNIAPGESKNFKISCGCSNSPPALHDSYKVEVTNEY